MSVTIRPGVERRVARHPGVRNAVRETTESIGRRATARLAATRDTGNARIEVEQDGTDGIVSLFDPEGNALAIEFGHTNNRSGKYLEGAYVLTSAVLDERAANG